MLDLVKELWPHLLVALHLAVACVASAHVPLNKRDPRSLRLNFEPDDECYDAGLAAFVRELVAAKLTGAHAVTLQELRDCPLPARIRDGVARLAAPYLWWFSG